MWWPFFSVLQWNLGIHVIRASCTQIIIMVNFSICWQFADLVKCICVSLHGLAHYHQCYHAMLKCHKHRKQGGRGLCTPFPPTWSYLCVYLNIGSVIVPPLLLRTSFDNACMHVFATVPDGIYRHKYIHYITGIASEDNYHLSPVPSLLHRKLQNNMEMMK